MEQQTKVRTLSVEEWYELSQTGTNIPVRIPVNGVSMQPLIRRNRDHVTIVPLHEIPQRGDIVLFVRRAEYPYVLHRVWEVRGNALLTWGDNCAHPDGWLPISNVWGIAKQLERGGRVIDLRTEKNRRTGCLLAPVFHMKRRMVLWCYRLAGHLPGPVNTTLKKLLKR